MSNPSLPQGLLMLSTVLGPATIMLMMAGAINPVLSIDMWQAYVLVVGPVSVYLIICFMTKPETQLNLAAVLSAIYSLVMMAVVVGTAVQVVEDTILSPNAIFLFMLVGIFILSAVFHPQEFICLLPGALYMLALPSAYVLLMIYAMCNLNIVSWGTRETSSLEKRAQQQNWQQGNHKQEGGFYNWMHKQEDESTCCGQFFKSIRRCCGAGGNDVNTEILRQVIEKLDKVEAGMRSVTVTSSVFQRNKVARESHRSTHSRKSNKSNKSIEDIEEEADNGDQSSSYDGYSDDSDMFVEEERDELINPRWIEDVNLKSGGVQYLPMREIEFWQRCIAKYLHPINPDKAQEAKIITDLKSLRNNIAFAFFMMNAFWMVIIFMLQRVKDRISITAPKLGGGELTVEPLGLIFLTVFAFIVLIQFLAMLRHRWGTLLHIIASTDLKVDKRKFNQKQAIRDMVEYAMKMQKLTGIEADDLTDFDYMSGTDSRAPSMQASNLYPHSVSRLSGRSLGSDRDSDSASQIAPRSRYSHIMMDNPGFIGDSSTPKPAGTSSAIESADESVKAVDVTNKKKGKSMKLGGKKKVTDKNALRRMFDKRYKRMIRSHSKKTGADPRSDPFSNKAINERRRAKKEEQKVEEIGATFNNFDS